MIHHQILRTPAQAQVILTAPRIRKHHPPSEATKVPPTVEAAATVAKAQSQKRSTNSQSQNRSHDTSKTARQQWQMTQQQDMHFTQI